MARNYMNRNVRLVGGGDENTVIRGEDARPNRGRSSPRSSRNADSPADLDTGRSSNVSQAFRNPSPNMTSAATGQPVYAPGPNLTSSRSGGDSSSFTPGLSSSATAPTFSQDSFQPPGTAAANAPMFNSPAQIWQNLIHPPPAPEGQVGGPVLPLFGVSPSSVAAVAGAVQKGTTVSKAINVGKVGVQTAGKGGVAADIAANTKNAAATASWLSRLAGSARNPSFVVGALMATIGTYPFAGFIKEEALQTLGFATNSAIKAGQLDLAQQSLDAQSDVLNPDIWDQLKAGVPFVNVLDQLDNFYGAAVLKTNVDQAVVNDLRVAKDTGESDDEMYARIAQQKVDAREAEQADWADYYAQVERNRQAAKAAERAADEAYWADILSERDEQIVKNEEFDEDYWTEYYKTLAKARDNSAPSNLKFGLL